MLVDLVEFTLKVIFAMLMVIFVPLLITSGVVFFASLIIATEWVVSGIGLITYITMLSLFIVVGAAVVTD